MDGPPDETNVPTDADRRRVRPCKQDYSRNMLSRTGSGREMSKQSGERLDGHTDGRHDMARWTDGVTGRRTGGQSDEGTDRRMPSGHVYGVEPVCVGIRCGGLAAPLCPSTERRVVSAPAQPVLAPTFVRGDHRRSAACRHVHGDNLSATWCEELRYRDWIALP